MLHPNYGELKNSGHFPKPGARENDEVEFAGEYSLNICNDTLKQFYLRLTYLILYSE